MPKPEPDKVREAQQAAQALLDENLPGRWVSKMDGTGLLYQGDKGPESIIGLERVEQKIAYLDRCVLEELAVEQQIFTDSELDVLAANRKHQQVFSAIVDAAKGKSFAKMHLLTRLFLQETAHDDFAASWAASLRATAQLVEDFLQRPDAEEKLQAHYKTLASKRDMLGETRELNIRIKADTAREIGVVNIPNRHEKEADAQLKAMRDDDPVLFDERVASLNQRAAEELARATIERIRNAPAALRILADVIEYHYGPEIDQVMGLIAAQIPKRGEGRQGGR